MPYNKRCCNISKVAPNAKFWHFKPVCDIDVSISSMEWDQILRSIFKNLQNQTGQKSKLFHGECVLLSPTVPTERSFTLSPLHQLPRPNAYSTTDAGMQRNGMGNVIEEPPSEQPSQLTYASKMIAHKRHSFKGMDNCAVKNRCHLVKYSS